MAGDPFEVFVAHLSLVTNENDFNAMRYEVIQHILANFFLKARTEGALVWKRNEKGLRGERDLVSEFNLPDNAGTIRTVEVRLTGKIVWKGLFSRQLGRYYVISMFPTDDTGNQSSSVIYKVGKDQPDDYDYKLPHEYTYSEAIYVLGKRLFEDLCPFVPIQHRDRGV